MLNNLSAILDKAEAYAKNRIQLCRLRGNQAVIGTFLLPPLIISGAPVIDEQPWKGRKGRSWVAKPSFTRRPEMIEAARGAFHVRANVRKLAKCCSIHFDAR
jgi:hypothetical protein